MNDDASGVPEHVAAYAAAVYMITVHDWSTVARIVAVVGLGSYDAARLCVAASEWARAHCAPDVLSRRSLATAFTPTAPS